MDILNALFVGGDRRLQPPRCASLQKVAGEKGNRCSRRNFPWGYSRVYWYTGRISSQRCSRGLCAVILCGLSSALWSYTMRNVVPDK